MKKIKVLPPKTVYAMLLFKCKNIDIADMIYHDYIKDIYNKVLESMNITKEDFCLINAKCEKSTIHFGKVCYKCNLYEKNITIIHDIHKELKMNMDMDKNIIIYINNTRIHRNTYVTNFKNYPFPHYNIFGKFNCCSTCAFNIAQRLCVEEKFSLM